ncbi:leukocyte elastase inhibitor-like isoform X2 [Amphiura filiformis]
MAERGQSSGVTPHVSKVAEASNTFALHLYQSLQPGFEGENLFFSPMSISTALAMTQMGTRGDTAAQVAKVLRFNLVEEKKLHQAFQELNALLYDTNRPYTLKSANRLFGQKGDKFLPDFLDGTRSHYGAHLEAVDFARETEAARQLINSWVEEQTAQKITNLLPSGSLNPLVSLVLVNAIYFKGDWLKQFDAKLTHNESFHLSATRSVQIPMMHQKPIKYNFTYDRNMKCKLLDLPYKGDHLSMVLLLPDEIEGLSKIEANLNVDVLNKLISNMEEVKVRVAVPKFKFSQSFNLHETLNQMGIQDLFIDGKADLSGINGGSNLYVSKVIHKAFIEVNEEGSEAAAATAVTMKKRSIDMSPEFRANHPFLFLIRDNSSGAILFLGRLTKPSEASSRDEL